MDAFLFQTYGKVVKRLFTPGTPGESDNMPRALFPSEVLLAPSAHDATQHRIEHLPQGEWQRTAETIEYLRKALDKECHQRDTAGLQRPPPRESITAHFQTFLQALEQGNETKLANNPFYELTKLVFRHTLSGANRLLYASQIQWLSQAPKPLFFFAPDHLHNAPHLPGLPRRFATWLCRTTMTVKHALVMALTLLSAALTTLVVYHHLQPDTDGMLVGGSLPLIAGCVAGFLLVWPVLEFKSRLYRGMATSGGVLKGVRGAFAKHPKWLTLLVVLTLLSIKSNDDGLRTILFKTADLTRQAAYLQAHAHAILGDPTRSGEDSLHSRMRQLKAWTTWVHQSWQQRVNKPQHQRGSRTQSSRNAHDWALFFLFHGGYQAGIDDVVHRYGNRAEARHQDRLLNQTSVDATRSLEAKMADVMRTYEAQVARTTLFVQGELQRLNRLFAGPPDAPSLLFNFTLAATWQQHLRQGNRIARALAAALQAGEADHRNAVVALNHILITFKTQARLLSPSIFTHVKGDETRGPADIQPVAAPAPLPALQQLALANPASADAPTPGGTHTPSSPSNPLEMSKKHLVTPLLSGWIILCAAGLDLGELLLFGGIIAWRGRKDQQHMAERCAALKKWETTFVDQGIAFFDRSDIRKIFPGIPFPRDREIQHAWHLSLEAIAPMAKDAQDQSGAEIFRAWFAALFLPARITDMVAYNARTTAISHFKIHPNVALGQWVGRIFSGMRWNRGLENRTFEELSRALKSALQANQAQTQRALDHVLLETQENDNFVHHTNRRAFLKRLDHGSADLKQLNKLLRPFHTEIPTQGDNEHTSALPHPPRDRGRLLSQLWTHAPSYSRRTWLKELAGRDRTFQAGISLLHAFIPTLNDTLRTTLPALQRDLFDPLMDIFARLPSRCAQAIVLDPDQLRTTFTQLEKLSMEMLGLSHFLQPGMDEKLLGMLTSEEELQRMTHLLQKGQSKEARFLDQIHQATDILRTTLQLAQTLEASLRSEMLTHQVLLQKAEKRLQQTLTQINVHGWEARKKRPPSHVQLEVLVRNQPLLVRAPQTLAALTAEADTFLSTPPCEGNLARLSQIALEAHVLADKVKDVLTNMKTPTHIDRRLEKVNRHAGGKETEQQADQKRQQQARKAAGKSRRQAERESFSTPLQLVTDHGHLYYGTSSDISATGVSLLPTVPPTQLTQHDQGTLRLLDDPTQTPFSCQIAHITPTSIALHLQDNLAAFETISAQLIMQSAHLATKQAQNRSSP